MVYDLDYQILLHIISELSTDMIIHIEHSLVNNFDQYMRFRDICETAIQSKEMPDKMLSVEELKKGWNEYSKLNRTRFDKLINFYYLRYKEDARKNGRKGTILELNTNLSGHNKWYRMLNDHGIGPQYHDDVRKLCFLFKLSYGEAAELLWSAGQPFDSDSLRDYIIAECLVKKLYDPDRINEQLEAMKQKGLFYTEKREGGN